MSVVNTREVASEPVDPAPVELSPAQGTLVNAQHLSSVSARTHDDRSHSGSEQTMSRLQQPFHYHQTVPVQIFLRKLATGN